MQHHKYIKGEFSKREGWTGGEEDTEYVVFTKRYRAADGSQLVAAAADGIANLYHLVAEIKLRDLI